MYSVVFDHLATIHRKNFDSGYCIQIFHSNPIVAALLLNIVNSLHTSVRYGKCTMHIGYLQTFAVPCTSVTYKHPLYHAHRLPTNIRCTMHIGCLQTSAVPCTSVTYKHPLYHAHRLPTNIRYSGSELETFPQSQMLWELETPTHHVRT